MGFMGKDNIAWTLQVWRGACGRHLVRLSGRKPDGVIQVENRVFASPWEVARWLRDMNRQHDFHSGCNLETAVLAIICENTVFSREHRCNTT